MCLWYNAIVLWIWLLKEQNFKIYLPLLFSERREWGSWSSDHIRWYNVILFLALKCNQGILKQNPVRYNQSRPAGPAKHWKSPTKGISSESQELGKSSLTADRFAPTVEELYVAYKPEIAASGEPRDSHHLFLWIKVVLDFEHSDFRVLQRCGMLFWLSY